VLKYLIGAWKLRQANRIARSLVKPVRVCLVAVTDENGELDPDISDDDFVLTYIFGMVLGSLESIGKDRDAWVAALTLRQTFEYLFGHGQQLAEWCAALAKRDDEDFKYAMHLGYSDVQRFSRSGSGRATGLMEHLKLYKR
jgi:hypothetical protein